MFCCPAGESQGLVNRACAECAELSAGYQSSMAPKNNPEEGKTLTLGAINALLSPIRIDATGLA